MNHFIKKLLLFTVLSAFLLAAFIYAYMYKFGSLDSFPPPSLTNSYSYNDKLLFCRNKKADYVCIGSSLSLNNIDSKTCIQNFHSDSYLNISSWGLTMADTYTLLKSYTNFSKPKKILISSNIIDFRSNEQKKADAEEIEHFFSMPSSTMLFYYIKHSTLKELLDEIKQSKVIKESHATYETLYYDAYGAAPLHKDGFTISDKRWEDSTTGPVQKIQYMYLDSIAIFCKTNNIEMLFFQSPIREGLYKKIDLKLLNAHTAQTESIIKKYNYAYVNSLETLWNDSLFVDGTHLSSVGAKAYTEYCFKKINK